MKHWPWWALALVLTLAAGCSRSAARVKTADAPAAGEPGPTPLHGPGLAAPAPAPVISENADAGTALRQMSLELRKYVLRTKTAPLTFEEFAAKDQLQPPPAPQGKKYAIRDGAVILVAR